MGTRAEINRTRSWKSTLDRPKSRNGYGSTPTLSVEPTGGAQNESRTHSRTAPRSPTTARVAIHRPPCSARSPVGGDGRLARLAPLHPRRVERTVRSGRHARVDRQHTHLPQDANRT